MDRERLFRLVMLFAQLTQAEAAHHVPRAFGFCYRSPHAPCSSLLIGSRREDRPSDIHPRWSLEIGAAATQRLPSTLVAVVTSSHMVPRALIAIRRTAAAGTHAVATHSLSDADAPISAFRWVAGGPFFPI